MRDDAFTPLELPAELWQRPDTRDALTRRDIGFLFGLARKYAGASQTRIANVCGMSQPEVSKISSGQRNPSAPHVLHRIADGLAMPDEARVLLGLKSVATLTPGFLTQTALPVQAEPTVPEPDPDHTALLVRMEGALSIDTTAVELLRSHTHSLRLLDRTFGAPAVLGQMRLHISTVEDALRHSINPGTREPLGWVLADASALAGWQSIDTGDLTSSWEHFERARAAALEARDRCVLSFAAGEQAYVLLEMGRPTQAAELLAYVIDDNADHIPARMAAWLYAAQAEAHAAAGNPDACRYALDQAARQLPDYAEDEEAPYLSLDRNHFARWRGNCLAALGDDEAIADLTDALTAMDPAFKRAAAGLHCDLATAFIVKGETDAAQAHLSQARDFARLTGSTRQRRRITRLAQQLAA